MNGLKKLSVDGDAIIGMQLFTLIICKNNI